MRRVLVLVIALFLTAFALKAQHINGSLNSIGLRAGWGAEVSYQRYVAPLDRIEISTGLNRYGFLTNGTYQWLFKLSDISDASYSFRGYAGAGAGIGYFDWKKKEHTGFSVSALAQVGIECGFRDIPFTISLDYRPGLYFCPNFYFDLTSIALGLRYTF